MDKNYPPYPNSASPRDDSRACLCKNGTYSRQCCDGSMWAQGIGNITGTRPAEPTVICGARWNGIDSQAQLTDTINYSGDFWIEGAHRSDGGDGVFAGNSATQWFRIQADSIYMRPLQNMFFPKSDFPSTNLDVNNSDWLIWRFERIGTEATLTINGESSTLPISSTSVPATRYLGSRLPTSNMLVGVIGYYRDSLGNEYNNANKFGAANADVFQNVEAVSSIDEGATFQLASTGECVFPANSQEWIVNGSFDSGADGWAISAFWNITDVATKSESPTTEDIFQIANGILDFVDGEFQVSFTITNYQSGNLQPIVCGVVLGTPRSANGTFTETITIPDPNVAAAVVGVVGSADFVGSVDDISIINLI